MEIISLRHAYPEKAGFRIIRENGHPAYTFLHFHNSVEIIKDGILYKTEPHAVILYQKGTPQFFRSPTPLLHDWMHFDGEIAPLLREAGLEPDKIYYPSSSGFITAIIGEMETEFYSAGIHMQRLLELKLEELFLKIGRNVGNEENTDLLRETKERFRYLRGKVFSNLERDWTIRDMAEEVHLSEARFFAIYRTVFGISPNADLINARMNSAQNMLAFTEKKIKEIAQELGYRNITHFIRQFRERNGMSPSEYRKQFSQNQTCGFPDKDF